MCGCHGATSRAHRLPTEARRPSRCGSAPVDQQQRPVVVARARPRRSAGAAPSVEAAAQQPLGLAEHPVDAELDVAAPGLDHAVGVEQHGVAAAAACRATAGTRRPRSARAPALGLVHQPAAGAGAAAGRPAGGRRCGSRSRRSPGRARGGPRSRSPRPSPGAGGSRWPPAGTRPAAARRAGRRTRRRAAARGCRPPRPCRRRRRRRARAGRRRAGRPPRSRRRTACRRPSAARTRRTSPRAASGSTPWLWIRSRRSTSIDSPMSAGDAEAGAAERGQQHDEAEHEDDHDRRSRCAA